MKYYEVAFTISPVSDDARDIVAALAGEAAFETFEETPTGIKGYVQQQLFDDDALRAILDALPLPGVTVDYTVSEAEDRDWNEQWEQEGFEPIIVRGERREERGERCVVIHDGRNLPNDNSLSSFLSPLSSDPSQDNSLFSLLSPLSSIISIEIDAHLAFGTGSHETTRMMCAALLDLDLTDRRVLDCGTGTGILAIAALKLGASEAVGYDIDEWSADNARHNAVINRVDDRFTSLLGDASILNKVEGLFDVITANINRNILLADMPAFVSKMAPGATLLLSGFYTEDIALLVERAKELGLTLQSQREDQNWAELSLVKN